jgi:hypothetical protein
MSVLRIYYILKPFIPRPLQILLRRRLALRKRLLSKNIWPIDERAGKQPKGWLGWPERKKFALVLTHDVETAIGQEKCFGLISLEQKMGFSSSFNFVPERYRVSPDLRRYLTNNGFEVGVHGLTHDGKLYASRKIFKKRAIKINHYLKEWGAVGFRSPAMHHNLDWIQDLNIIYDASTFDTDPFEPYSDGVGTIFPFRVSGSSPGPGFVELPYTLPQDSTLFVLFNERTIDIWKRKLDWVAKNGGMALMLTHPDYMSFNGTIQRSTEYPVQFYEQFLEYVKTRYDGAYWHVLPKDMALFWSTSAQLEQYCHSG